MPLQRPSLAGEPTCAAAQASWGRRASLEAAMAHRPWGLPWAQKCCAGQSPWRLAAFQSLCRRHPPAGGPDFATPASVSRGSPWLALGRVGLKTRSSLVRVAKDAEICRRWTTDRYPGGRGGTRGQRGIVSVLMGGLEGADVFAEGQEKEMVGGGGGGSYVRGVQALKIGETNGRRS